MYRGKSFVVDDQFAPLVYVLLGEGLEQEWPPLLDAICGAARSHPSATCAIIDARRAPMFGSQLRTQAANDIKANMSLFEGHTIGITYIVSSSVIRGGITAFFWFVKVPFPFAVHPNLDEAVRWCEERIVERGFRLTLPVTEVIARLRRITLT